MFFLPSVACTKLKLKFQLFHFRMSTHKIKQEPADDTHRMEVDHPAISQVNYRASFS